MPLGTGIGALYSVTTISGPPLALMLNNQGFVREDFRASLAIIRIAESTLRHLGIGPTLNPASPVLVARRDESTTGSPASAGTAGAVVSFVSDAPAGNVPDLAGMSARDAVRTLVKLGVNVRIAGDGFVVAQLPPPGAQLDTGAGGQA